jgi:Secretion system C-terminal sorting domain/Fibronectin type III domain
MKKFTNYVCTIIMFCLVVAANNGYSKSASFFGSQKQKTEWNKKGFGSSIARPDMRLANVKINVDRQLVNINAYFNTCLTTTATTSTLGTSTATFTTTTTATYSFAPPVLGGITATSPTLIQVSISSVPPGQSSYNIYRNSQPLIITVAADKTNTGFKDRTALPNTLYNYVIESVNADGCLSGFSNAVSKPTLGLPVPANVAAVAKSPTSVFVSWSDVLDEENYEVFRSLNGVNYTALASPAANGLSYLDNSVLPDKDYYYIVRGKFGTGFGAFSSPALVHTPPLPVPANLNATAINCSQINLTWQDASGAYAKEKYILERSENGGPYAVINNNIAAAATSYSEVALKPNTSYSYRLQAGYSVGSSAYSNIGSATTKPLNLTLGQFSATTADIKWELCSSFVQAWKIYVSTNNGPFTEFAQATAVLDKYSFKNLLPNTKYAVYIVNVFGAGFGGASNTIQFTTPKFPGPTNLTAIPNSTTAMKLNWIDNSNGPDNEDGFVLYKSIDNGVTFTQIQVLPTKTEYIDNGLKASQKVCYYITARYFNGFSDASNTACNVTCPNPVTEITKAEAVSPTQINLEWTAPENLGTTTITVEGSTDGIAFTKLADIAGTSTSYKDLSVLPNQKKYYRVNVKNEGSCSSIYSLIASTTSCPLAPTGVKATTVSSSSIEVNWDLVADIKTYIIERSTDNIVYAKAGEVEGTLSKFVDTKLSPSKKYYYRVSAKNEGTCTSATSTITLESTATTCAAPPSNLVAVANSAKEIKITFTDNSPDEAGFEVEWSKDEKTWAKVGNVLTPNTTSLTISTGIDAETKYFFRVRATGEICNSDYSNVANVTTNPPAPTGLTAKGVKISQNDLAWTNTSKTANTIEIQRASGTDNNFTKLADVAVNLATYQSIGLTPATSYKYRIRYGSVNGFSDWSNVADATTLVISANENNELAKQVSLYPVPTQNTLYIKPAVSILGKVHTKVVTITGAELMNQDFNGFIEGKTETINVSNIGTGIYFLEVSTQKGSFSKKFIKQ